MNNVQPVGRMELAASIPSDGLTALRPFPFVCFAGKNPAPRPLRAPVKIRVNPRGPRENLFLCSLGGLL